MIGRKKPPHYDVSNHQYFTSPDFYEKPAARRPKISRLASGLGLVIIVAIASYIVVILYRHHQAGQVHTITQEQRDRVQQSPQENQTGVGVPRSSVSNGTQAQPTNQ